MFETIAWATDGAETADEALPLVTELALAHGSTVVALHINERFGAGRAVGDSLLVDEDDRRRWIASKIDDMRAAGIDARLEVVSTRRRHVAAELAFAAEAAGADVIVVATHGLGEAAALVHGSVARELTHTAQCPVLVVPAQVTAAVG